VWPNFWTCRFAALLNGWFVRWYYCGRGILMLVSRMWPDLDGDGSIVVEQVPHSRFFSITYSKPPYPSLSEPTRSSSPYLYAHLYTMSSGRPTDMLFRLAPNMGNESSKAIPVDDNINPSEFDSSQNTGDRSRPQKQYTTSILQSCPSEVSSLRVSSCGGLTNIYGRRAGCH
jgi:hypothetical protein